MRRFRYLIIGPALVAVACAWALRPSDGATASTLDRLSTPGMAVRLPARDVRTTRLQTAGFTRISRLAIHGSRGFYRLNKANGGACFGTGPAGAAWPLGTVKCRIAPPYFPSPELPVLDLSVVGLEQGGDLPEYLRIAGFAADGVASIGAIDSSGSTVGTIPVSGNVYSASPPANTVRLVALDADGHVVARLP